MDPKKQFKEILQRTEILKNPKHRLSTFGQTRIHYFFLSEVEGFKDRSRLREGLVVAESPQIITPDKVQDRFEGFGNESEAFGNWLSEKYGDAFQGLEYKFKNESKSSAIEYTSLKVLAERIEGRLKREDFDQSAIIRGPDPSWQISLMKFIVDECMASFTVNLKELDEHGYFDNPEEVLKDRKKEIDRLFLKARKDPALLPLLGKKLHRYGLFKDYEDRFFRLIK